MLSRICCIISLCVFPPFFQLEARCEDPSSLYYGDFSLSSTYVTPRGLVVQDDGLVLKTLIGGAFDLYKTDGWLQKVALNTGVYTNFLSDPSSVPTATGGRRGSGNIFDIDPYIGLDLFAYKKWRFNASYLPFFSTTGLYDAVHNVVFLLSYNDTEDLGAYALQPYARTFTTLSGASTTILGKTPASYLELGVGPKITLLESAKLALSIPTAVFLAEPDFYGNSGALGTISSGLLLTKQVGTISLRAGVEYFFLRNQNLRQAANILGNGDEPSKWIATVGMSFAFAR